MKTSVEFLILDNLRKQIDLPVVHVSVQADNYFDGFLIEQHLGVIYSKVNVIESTIDTHSISVIADAKSAAPLTPPKLRRLLAKS